MVPQKIPNHSLEPPDAAAASPEGAAGASQTISVHHAPPWHRQEETANRGPKLLTGVKTSGSAGPTRAQKRLGILQDQSGTRM